MALEQGGVIAAGTPDTVLADARVVSSYLGTNEDVVHRSGDRPAQVRYMSGQQRAVGGRADPAPARGSVWGQWTETRIARDDPGGSNWTERSSW